MTFDKSPHAVMHLGMTGWVKFSSEETGYYRSKKESQEEAEWPPKYCKFLMRFEKETVQGEEKDEVEVAFIDARRLARIRLVECEAEEIRNNSPLKENGPDPVVDKEKFTVEFLSALLRKKRVPVKALLLDQANISGESLERALAAHSIDRNRCTNVKTQASATGWQMKSYTRLVYTQVSSNICLSFPDNDAC
jgi:formamidopyrimidine-DNA glycosylase